MLFCWPGQKQNAYQKFRSKHVIQEHMDDEEQPEILLDLWSVLSELRTPSTFACGGEIPIVLPGINQIFLPYF